MELIVISDARLKVMLTAEDVRRYELGGKSVDGESPEVKRVLRELLDEVKSRVGFDASGERVLVQLYPSKGGGCELFVTKLGKSGDAKPSEERLSLSSPSEEPALRTAVFSFCEVSRLLAVCRALKRMGYRLFSTAYASDSGELWLVLREPCREKRPGRLAFIEEFGRRRQGASDLSYIKEHGRCIAPSDAVSLLAELA